VPGANIHPEAQLTGRQRRRLRLARENGYLNAACSDARKLLAAYARWCWLLRIPVVWSERRSPYSRYGRVGLDLYTTSHRLTADGQADMQAFGICARASPHDARWERVPLCDLDRLSAAVFRASTRAANCMPNRSYPSALPDGLPAKVVFIDEDCAVSA
jgi:hypothetical protein